MAFFGFGISLIARSPAVVYGLNTAPVLAYPPPSYPPHTINLEPVQVAVQLVRAVGTPEEVDVAIQVSEIGSYSPPVAVVPLLLYIPHINIFDPVQIARGMLRGEGTLLPAERELQVSIDGS